MIEAYNLPCYSLLGCHNFALVKGAKDKLTIACQWDQIYAGQAKELVADQ